MATVTVSITRSRLYRSYVRMFWWSLILVAIGIVLVVFRVLYPFGAYVLAGSCFLFGALSSRLWDEFYVWHFEEYQRQESKSINGN